MLTTLQPETVSENVAKVEMALAVGLIIGPLIGTALIKWQSFATPFLLMSGLYGILFIAGFIFLPKKRLSSEKMIAKEDKLVKLGMDRQQARATLKKTKHLQVSYFTLIFNKGSFFALATVTTMMTGYSFLDPILEP